MECSQNTQAKIMLFDLETGGHHPSYIHYLIDYWGEQDLSGSLNIVVSPKFVQQHTHIVALASKYGKDRVNFLPITVAEQAAFFPRSSYLQRKIYFFQAWKLCCSYAELLKATHCLLMYFDTFQIPILMGGRFPCFFSAIYFRPTFHYNHFEQYKPGRIDPLYQQYEKLLLSLTLKRQDLQTLFCLDPFVVKHSDHFNNDRKMVYLPDPVRIYHDSAIHPQQLRAGLGIDANRKVFLLFGLLDERKGLLELLEAVSLLSVSLCEQLCLLLVGSMDRGLESEVLTRKTQISESLPVQIIIHNHFIADHEIQAYFQLADVILAPYQRHVGMSGILVRAAAAQKPVLSSDYGLMGEITRRYQLGVTVDSTQPNQIAQGLTQFLLASPAKFGDRSQMRFFAHQNTAENFAKTIFQKIQTFPIL